MKIKDYFKQAFTHGCKSWALFAKGLFFGMRRLFTSYPNPTWAAIMAVVVVLSVVKIGEARSERDSYCKATATLQHQLDSCLQKEIKYVNIKR